MQFIEFYFCYAWSRIVVTLRLWNEKTEYYSQISFA